MDGILQGTATLPSPPANNTRALNIGFAWGGGTSQRYFQGVVDEVQIYAQPLPAGTYNYSPAAGTVLDAGSGQPLSVEFDPTDSSDLNSASKSVSINVKKADQSINFGALADKTYGDPAFTVSATGGGSGNPVTFASTTTSVCTTSGINGSTVTIIAAGSCSITASQAGNDNYNPAPDVIRSFTVNKAHLMVKADDQSKTYDGAVFSPFTATISGFVPARADGISAYV